MEVQHAITVGGSRTLERTRIAGRAAPEAIRCRTSKLLVLEWPTTASAITPSPAVSTPAAKSSVFGASASWSAA